MTITALRHFAVFFIVLLSAFPPSLHAQDIADWLRKRPGAAGISERPSVIVPRVAIEAPSVEPAHPKLKLVPQQRIISLEVRGAVSVPGAVSIDTRRRVEGDYFKHLPFSAVTRILVKYRGSSAVYQGSGFLVESDLVITAAHVLHSREFGRAEKVFLSAGCLADRTSGSVDTTMFQSADAGQLRTHPNWGPNDYGVAHDYGAILLTDAALFKACGRFRVQAADDRYLSDQARRETEHFIVAGFPVDRDLGERQWMARGGLAVVGSGFIRHLIDTEKGQSGSPLLSIGVEPTSGRQVPVALGVHSRGGEAGLYNVAARVDAEFIRLVNAWKNELASFRSGPN